MGGGSSEGGLDGEQRFYQQMQLRQQAESLKIAKQQMEIAKQQIVEPEKKIDSTKAAAADAQKNAALRRGIGSAFHRDTYGGGASGSSATSGSSAKLGE